MDRRRVCPVFLKFSLAPLNPFDLPIIALFQMIFASLKVTVIRKHQLRICISFHHSLHD